MTTTPNTHPPSDTFHPDFAIPPPKQPGVFESSDGVRFWFDLSVVSDTSTFFAGLASLPVPSNHDASAVLPLLNTSSPALAFILDAVKYNTTTCDGSAPLDPALLPSLARSTAVLDDILSAADAYDLAAVYEPLLAVLERDAWPPSTVYLVSVIADHPRTALWAHITVLAGSAAADPWSMTHLKTREPRRHALLFQELALRDKMYDAFMAACTQRLKECNTLWRCRLTKLGCPYVRSFGGDSKQLCALFMAHVWKHLATHGLASATDNRKLATFCKGMIECRRCARTVAEVARTAWGKHAFFSIMGLYADKECGYHSVVCALQLTYRQSGCRAETKAVRA